VNIEILVNFPVKEDPDEYSGSVGQNPISNE
jgi:hypothetical protein